jgi:hypothetical protein
MVPCPSIFIIFPSSYSKLHLKTDIDNSLTVVHFVSKLATLFQKLYITRYLQCSNITDALSTEYFFKVMVLLHLECVPEMFSSGYISKTSTILKSRGKIEKNIVLHSFYRPFCRACLFYSTSRCARRALKNACDKMVSYKTCIINYYFLHLTISHITIKRSFVTLPSLHNSAFKDNP